MYIVVTGASSGLGRALLGHLIRDGHTVVNWSLDTGVDVTKAPSLDVAQHQLPKKIDVLVNCAGVNGINFIPDVDDELDWDRIMDVNAKGILLTTQALLPQLNGGTICNIVSNAAHLPMTGSIAYNASKAAAYIMTKQMQRELFKTHNITVFGVAPNKLKGTKMSELIDERVCAMRGWTKEEATKYQLAALPAGEETDPETLAEFIAFLLSNKQRHKYLAGCVLDYGAP